jgi:hypothetical protein
MNMILFMLEPSSHQTAGLWLLKKQYTEVCYLDLLVVLHDKRVYQTRSNLLDIQSSM